MCPPWLCVVSSAAWGTVRAEVHCAACSMDGVRLKVSAEEVAVK